LSEPETLQQATALPGAAPVASASAPRTAGFDAASGEVSAPSMLDERAAVGLATTAIRFEGSTSRASSQDVATQLPQIASPGILQPQQIRRVNGDLVNMRTGPGTSNAVIGQLPRGAAVEILGDNGAGWVRLRPVDGGPEGWVADFLLTRG
jgi:uncharacterized protein YgiM (DUF1202 family)